MPSAVELPSPAALASPVRAVQRIRHPLVLRRLTVQRKQALSPHVLRVTLGGTELEGFVSASFDDHVKLMLPPQPGAPLVLPMPGPDGPVLPPGIERPTMRDYTPRHFEVRRGELDIEFALHGDGPAARWAEHATIGQPAAVGGPRGSFVIPHDYDWHLLIGDETALPAIARRLEELPASARAIALVHTADAADRRTLATRADLQLHWIGGPTPAGLVAATAALVLPPGEGYAWAAGEAATIAATRRVLVESHGLDKAHIRAAAYWKQGASAHHENL